MRRSLSITKTLQLRHALLSAGFCCFALLPLALAQHPSTNSMSGDSVAPIWKTDDARHLIGLAGVDSNIRGTLMVSPEGIAFTSRREITYINASRIIALSAGDQRVEKGGASGRIGRMLPFGGGQVVALASQAQMDLLTIEYRDARNAYRGAVFAVPHSEATRAKQVFSSLEIKHGLQPAVDGPETPCKSGAERNDVIKLSTIESTGLALPAEYEAFLYEQLMRRLEDTVGAGGVIRDGNQSGGSCADTTVTISVTEFRKGNQVVRAASGPLAMTGLGATRLLLHLTVSNRDGKVLIDRDLKASSKNDSGSLGITDAVAKKVAKQVRKARFAEQRTKPLV